MDNLRAIIRTLSPNQQKDFRQFLQRNKQMKKRKDMELFELLSAQQHLDKKEVLHRLYGTSNASSKNAYHTIRKRLYKSISEFLYLQSVDLDHSKSNEVVKSLLMIEHLLAHQLLDIAWKYLTKEEEVAIQHELNKELVLIYDIQIRNFSTIFSKRSLEEIIALRIKANALFQEEEKLKMIGAMVRQKLEEVILKGEEIDLQLMTDQFILQFELENALFDRPKLFYDFVFITRAVVLSKKEYPSFERFVLHAYKKLNRSNYLSDHPKKHLALLYVVAHTLYRNKKFDSCCEYLDLMSEVLDYASVGLYKMYFPKYLLLYAAAENFRGNLDFSIELLSQTLSIDYLEKQDRLNGTLNLSVYYFERGEFKKANEVLLNIEHTDQWLQKVMGKEWRLKKMIIEAINYYELAHVDLAYDRIESIQRIFADLLKTDRYQKVGVFLKIIKDYFNDPAMVQSEAFYERVESSFEWVGVAHEDLQEMAYYAWLKSKMINASFYKTLINLIAS